MRHPRSIGDLLQDEFALLQSDFTGVTFCYSGRLPVTGRPLDVLIPR
jgi:hypothetical protein